MKRQLVLSGLFLGLSLLPLPAPGQDAAVTNAAADAATNAASKAAAVAEQQGVDEKFKQLAADIETLRAASQLLLDKLSALKEDLQQIRADQTRLAAGAVSREDLKSLAQRIEEVDKKRQEDKDAISEEIKKTAARVETVLASLAEAGAKPPVKPPGLGAAPGAENGIWYTMKERDTLDAVVANYNSECQRKGLKTISLQQAKDANPNIVDWNRVKTGQKILIPRPAE
jgi:membrane-bound lytic murein transglycosylase B